MKTLFLNQDSIQIDPISHRIKGFSFHKFEDDRWHSIISFSLFSQSNLTFKHSLDVKINLEAKEARYSRIVVSREFDYSKNPIMIYVV